MKSGTFPSLKRTSTLAATRSTLFHNTLSISVNEAWASFRDILQRFIYKDASLISKKVKGRLCPSLTPDVKKGMVFSEKPTKLLKKTIGLLLNGNAAEYPALLKKKKKSRYNRDIPKDCSASPDIFRAATKKLYSTLLG